MTVRSVGFVIASLVSTRMANAEGVDASVAANTDASGTLDTPPVRETPTVSASTTPHWLHGIIGVGIGVSYVQLAPQTLDYPPGTNLELMSTVGAEIDVPWRCLRVGGVGTLHAGNGGIAGIGGNRAVWWQVGGRGSFRLAPALRAHLSIGTFECTQCRSSDVPGFLNVGVDHRVASVFVETYVIRYDAFEPFRPLGTEVRTLIGVSSTTWQGALVALALDAVVVLTGQLRPPPGD